MSSEPRAAPRRVAERVRETKETRIRVRIDLDGFDRIRSACAEVCGDGILTPGEQCDDGNDVDTDGCANDCTFNII